MYFNKKKKGGGGHRTHDLNSSQRNNGIQYRSGHQHYHIEINTKHCEIKKKKKERKQKRKNKELELQIFHTSLLVFISPSVPQKTKIVDNQTIITQPSLTKCTHINSEVLLLLKTLLANQDSMADAA